MTPFKTNFEQKVEKIEKLEKQNMFENTKQQNSSNPLLELKLNQPNYQQQSQSVYPMSQVLIPNMYTPYGISNLINPWWTYTSPNDIPVIKKYNINLGGINGDAVKIAHLYEDILPNDDYIIANTFNSINERLILHNFIRTMFVKIGDGEELILNNNSSKTEITNLLSRIKLLELNPYHYDKITNNHYKTLPYNFVLYRSCYPIRMNKYNTIECYKSSIGMNIRIYLLSKFDIDNMTINNTNRYKSDIWRDLTYYEFIKEEIIKKKLSPNFILLHSFYIIKNFGVDFKKFDIIKKDLIKNKRLINNNDIRNQLYKELIIEQRVKDTNEIVTQGDLDKYKLRGSIIENREKVIKYKVENDIKENNYNNFFDSDKCLVMLTEAPTQHLLTWSMRIYKEKNGPVKQMINNGYHDDKVWISILLQLFISCLIMINKQIIFNDFTWENNFFIKELNYNESNIGIWKYIYNNIPIFIPNYGNLLLIDSNFANITPDFTHIHKHDDKEIKYKILSNIMEDKNNIYELGINKMIECFNTAVFNQSFRNRGGMIPSDTIQNLINNINSLLLGIQSTYFNDSVPWDNDNKKNFLDELNNKLLIDIFINNQILMSILHNRIGTILKENEKQYISETFDNYTKRGTIIVKSISSLLYSFAMFLEKKNDKIYTILTTKQRIFDFEDIKDNNYITEEVNISEIFNYHVTPENMYELGKQFNIIDSYIINF